MMQLSGVYCKAQGSRYTSSGLIESHGRGMEEASPEVQIPDSSRTCRAQRPHTYMCAHVCVYIYIYRYMYIHALDFGTWFLMWIYIYTHII